MTSSRLPGKVLMPLAGKSVLERMIERHRRSKYTDEVVVATTTNAVDDLIVAEARHLGCKYFRGSEDDVLGRLTGAAGSCGADIVVQGMADSPLVDWRILDRIVEKLDTEKLDFVSNELEETFPVGFDARAFTYVALEEANRVATEPVYREHAGLFIYKHPERKFKLGNIRAEGDMVWPVLRLTLDTEDDYRLISAVYEALAPENDDFSAEDVIDFLKLRPDLVAINGEVKQRTPTLPQ
mgnify:CR=1 FL=1